MIITPALLASTFDEFSRQLTHVAGLFDYAQIDVMDGKLVTSTSFKEIERIATFPHQRYELHLMVEDPLAEMKKWQGIPGVFRVIFHAEAKADPLAVIALAREAGWGVGMALNPETPLSAAEPYLDGLDLVLFMTVHPGQQGAPFVPEVLDKIRQFMALPEHPLCAIDGSVNKTNIKELKDLGVDIVNVGSALTKAQNPKEAYQELQKAVL